MQWLRSSSLGPLICLFPMFVARCLSSSARWAQPPLPSQPPPIDAHLLSSHTMLEKQPLPKG